MPLSKVRLFRRVIFYFAIEFFSLYDSMTFFPKRKSDVLTTYLVMAEFSMHFRRNCANSSEKYYEKEREKRTANPLFERQSSFFVFASNWKTFYFASFHLNFHYISWGKVFLLHFRLIKHSAQLCWLYVSYF